MALGNMSIQDVCNGAKKVFSRHKKINEHAMIALHAMGYNGFKRWHRYRAREYYDLKLKIENNMFDNFGLTPDFAATDLEYTPKTIKEHLETMKQELTEGLDDLAQLSNRYCEITGSCCSPIDDAQKFMRKDLERVRRMILRFTDSDWLTIDIHAVDEYFHKKYKKLEKKSCECYKHEGDCCGHKV